MGGRRCVLARIGPDVHHAIRQTLVVVVVGQTPPPYGGQAMMIANLLKGRYSDVRLVHVRMAFSNELQETGRVNLRKLVHVPVLAGRIAVARYRAGASVLYYPPSGADRLPLYRDLALLVATRWMFAGTILHFHAGGVHEVYERLSPLGAAAFRRAYFGADAGVRTSALAPDDAARLGAHREFVVANGVEDAAAAMPAEAFRTRDVAPPTILFVGLLRESKGVLVLLEACADLRRRGLDFRLDLVGELHSRALGTRVARLIDENDLQSVVRLRGVLAGDDKHRAYAEASVFCFPSFFESETFGLVLIEAMQFGLPVVATSWRGIPSVVADGDNGYLVPIKDVDALADRLGLLLRDPELAESMGRRGRRLYEERFTLQRFHADIQKVFDAVRQDLSR